MSQRTLAFLALVVFAASAGGAIPGAQDPKAYTERDYARAELAFNRRTSVDMYNAIGKRDPKWDAQATAFLDAMCVVLTNVDRPAQYRIQPDRTAAEAEALGKAARDAGCDDPLVAYLYGVSLAYQNKPADRTAAIIRQAAGELMTSRYPLNRAAAAASRAFRTHDGAEAATREEAWER